MTHAGTCTSFLFGNAELLATVLCRFKEDDIIMSCTMMYKFHANQEILPSSVHAHYLLLQGLQ